MKKSSDSNSFFADTIVAPATAIGKGAIGIIRVSGKEALSIGAKIFSPKNKKLKSLKNLIPYSLCYGTIAEKDKGIIDDSLAAVFKAPNSYTGENCIEFYTHSSPYIMNRVLELLVENGARLANAGEFTQRAFLNGKMDLTQAEAVADLIASENKTAHKIALNQMRGGFSKQLHLLRDKLLKLASLVELELDFSEEDVEFASRSEIESIIKELKSNINTLTNSFSVGNAIRNGIPVAIVGAVNSGKSTLLNLIVGEERAIVSDIEGTTRDTIDDTVNIEGNLFRFTDTAGIRQTSNVVEIMGIERTYQKLNESSVVILVLDGSRNEDLETSIKNISQKLIKGEQEVIVVVNKIDRLVKRKEKHQDERYHNEYSDNNYDEESNNLSKELKERVVELCSKYKIKPRKIIFTSLKYSHSPIRELIKTLSKYAEKLTKGVSDGVLVTNVRHYEALTRAQQSLNVVEKGLKDNISADLLAQDLLTLLDELGSITGEITSQDILSNIFKNFCVGK